MRSVLIKELWEIYKEKADGNGSLEDFSFVGEALLNDFEDIDRKKKNAKGIFANVAELSKMSKTNYLTETETGIIKKFFDFDEEKTAVIQNKIYDIYLAFKEKNPNPDYGETLDALSYEEIFDEEKNIEFIQCASNTLQIDYALKQKEKYTLILCDEKLLSVVPAGLDVLTIKEAQNKSFENILFLSVNDGIIPKTEPKPSFIPQFLRKYFELETFEDENKRERDNFYRLFNAAKNVSFCYNNMSCFLLQLSCLSLYKDKIKRSVINAEIKVAANKKEIKIEKTSEMLDALRLKYGQRFLSPSAFNLYIDCPLQFYFKYIADIVKPDDDSKLNPAILGIVFHNTMESIYKNNEKNYETLVKETLDKYSGERPIYLKVISRMVENMLDYDRKNASFNVLGFEQECFFERDGIKIGGIIDRIDKTCDKIRIIDYKTGKIPDEKDFAKDISTLFLPNRPPKAGYQFQIYLYSLILRESGKYGDCEISPNLLFVLRNPIEVKNFDGFSREEFDEKLTEKLRELFNPQIPFKQCEKEDNCKYCDYCGLCNRL